jgi:hypothetical protein
MGQTARWRPVTPNNAHTGPNLAARQPNELQSRIQAGGEAVNKHAGERVAVDHAHGREDADLGDRRRVADQRARSGLRPCSAMNPGGDRTIMAP